MQKTQILQVIIKYAKKHNIDYREDSSNSDDKYVRNKIRNSIIPIMKEIKRVVKETGKKVLGICNGFQILCEAGLLPGTLRINKTQKFICKPVTIYRGYDKYIIPIAHAEGNYYHPHPAKVSIAYTYAEDVNGSMNYIAGIWHNNVLGMMPHPERAFELYHCSNDGFKVLDDFMGARSVVPAASPLLK